MLNFLKTNSENKDFQNLVVELDKELAIINGISNDFFAQYNKIDQLKNVVIAFNNHKAVGCGAMKELDKETMEIKRMYVPLVMRGHGIAVAILKELENWAKEMGYKKCVLETGDKMPEAITLCKKSNYKIIPNYGQYENVVSSICFEKKL